MANTNNSCWVEFNKKYLFNASQIASIKKDDYGGFEDRVYCIYISFIDKKDITMIDYDDDQTSRDNDYEKAKQLLNIN